MPCGECPKSELDRTDFLWPLRTAGKVKKQVEAARAELLDGNGNIRDRCIGRVRHIFAYEFIYEING